MASKTGAFSPPVELVLAVLLWVVAFRGCNVTYPGVHPFIVVVLDKLVDDCLQLFDVCWFVVL